MNMYLRDSVSSLVFFILPLLRLHDVTAHFGGGEEPTFITPGQTYRIAVGATVVLPCRVTSFGKYMLVWKHDIGVLTAGAIKITPDSRIRILSAPVQSTSVVPGLSGGGYSLEIRDVQSEDAGEYACQIGTIKPQEIKHKLEVLIPPRISYVSHTGRVEVSQGALITFECRASGNPLPVITWNRKNNVLPSGDRSVTGTNLLLQHVDRHAAGQYQCVADNGVAQPDSRLINVVVRYSPEVNVDYPSVHTGVGQESQLTCSIHAEPSPQVNWFKDTIQIHTSDKYTMQNRGTRYMLLIKTVGSTDFGNYSCVATNQLGRSSGFVMLTGTPSVALFESPALGGDTHAYNLTWTLTSYAPVNEYRLFYRQTSMMHRSLDYNFIPKHENISYYHRSDWNSVILPGDISSSARHGMSYVIRDLQPGSHYEARIQTKNSYGWSVISPVFHFSTRLEEFHPIVEQSKQTVDERRNLNPFLHNAVASIWGESKHTFLTLIFLSQIYLFKLITYSVNVAR